MKEGLKKPTILLEILLIVLLIGFVSADSCTITPRTDCTSPSKIVMGLSDTTNAHGQLISEAQQYSNVLCCDFDGVAACNPNTPKNKIIGLSSETNAHAQIPSLNDYVNNVCYTGLECKSGTANDCSNYDVLRISLSDNSNAHIGALNDYNTKICCKKSLVGGTAYWSNLKGYPITNADIKDIVAMSVSSPKKVAKYELYKEVAFWVDTNVLVMKNPSGGYFSWVYVLAGLTDDEKDNWKPGDYYFIAELEGGEKLRSDILTVKKYENNALPVANIFSPKKGDIFNVQENIDFSAKESYDEDDLIVKAEWDLDDGKTKNILSDFKDSYLVKGMKKIILYVTSGYDARERKSKRDKVNILIFDGAGTYVFAIISNPSEGEEILGTTVDFKSDGTYAMTCSGADIGSCTKIEPDYANWSIYRKDSSDNYNLVVEYKDKWSDSSTYTPDYMMEGSYKTKLKVDKGAVSETDDVLFDIFSIGTDYFCSMDGINKEDKGMYWIEIDTGIQTNSMGDCERDAKFCCPENYECAPDKGDEPGQAGCVPSSSFLCVNYPTQELCERDRAGVAKDSVKNLREDKKTCGDSVGVPAEGEARCEYFLDNCGCVWDDTKETCGAEYSVERGFCPPISLDIEIGSCRFSENTNDNCEDGFLNYVWDAEWTWDSATNIGWSDSESCPGEQEDCVLGKDGKYYYDPDKEAGKCIGGTNNVPCPEQIKLMFFGFWNFVVALSIVMFVYIWIFRKK